MNAFLLWAGYFLCFLNNQLIYAGHFSNYSADGGTIYIAELIDPPTERENSYKFTLKIRYLSINGKLYPVRGKVLAYAQKDSLVASLEYGSEIIFSNSPEPVRKPSNPGEFDYARYLS